MTCIFCSSENGLTIDATAKTFISKFLVWCLLRDEHLSIGSAPEKQNRRKRQLNRHSRHRTTKRMSSCAGENGTVANGNFKVDYVMRIFVLALDGVFDTGLTVLLDALGLANKFAAQQM